MSDTLEKTFDVASPARLNLSNIRGSVEIRPGEDGVIRVTAVKREHNGDAQRTQIEMHQEADGTVNVATRFPDGAWSWLFGSFPSCVDYTITAPSRCSLKVNGVSNSVDARGFDGEFTFNSVSGGIELCDLNGPVRIHTVSGEASGERISGALDLDTVSGDVSMKASNLTSVVCNAVSARLHLQTGLGAGPYRFNSVSGNVHLTLPPDSRCTAGLHTVSGKINSAFPVGAYSQTGGTHAVEVQGGGVSVDLKSISGDLILDSDGEIRPADVKGQPSADERRQVLESIERGEMTVDEGLARLRG